VSNTCRVRTPTDPLCNGRVFRPVWLKVWKGDRLGNRVFAVEMMITASLCFLRSRGTGISASTTLGDAKGNLRCLVHGTCGYDEKSNEICQHQEYCTKLHPCWVSD